MLTERKRASDCVNSTSSGAGNMRLTKILPLPCPFGNTKKEARNMETQTVSTLERRANMLRTALEVESGIHDATELIDAGFVVLMDKNGKHRESDDWDPGAGDRWTLTIDGVILLHLYQPIWFHAWQDALRRRN